MKAGLHLRVDMDDKYSDLFADSMPSFAEVSSDEEDTIKKHNTLIESAAAVYGKKIQRIQAPIRNEPSLEVSEFHLSDKIGKGKNLVKTLAGSLEKVGKHFNVAQKVKKVQCSFKPLPPPLEHPEAEKILRIVAYDNTKNFLDRWESVVTTNKVNPELHFPLNTPYFRLASTKDFIANHKPKSKLEVEFDQILQGVSEENKEKVIQEPKRTFYLNRKEILQQRREMAWIRAQQSYREAKARRQNKIKSKKYHRILRRERTKKQCQEFENLQKTDPEAALKKLQELEKIRAEERVSLRHCCTGHWVRNKTFHAKYDKQARHQLHQLLCMSRDLTVRENKEGSSESEEDAVEEHPVSEDNPWIKQDNVHTQFVKKYYICFGNEDNRNSMEVATSELDTKEDGSETIKLTKRLKHKPIILKPPFNVEMHKGFQVTDLHVKLDRDAKYRTTSNNEWKCTSMENSSENEEVKLNSSRDMDDLFEVIENKIKKKLKQKFSEINNPKTVKSPKKKMKKSNEKKDKSIAFQGSQVKEVPSLEVMNDETSEVPACKSNANSLCTWEIQQDGATLQLPQNGAVKKNKSVDSKPKGYSLEINPAKFIQIDEKELRIAQIPDIIVNEEDNSHVSENDKFMTIAEAFTDDDVVAELQQEKEAIGDHSKPKDINLTLPGWGEWAGKGISVSNRKKKRFVMKAPKHIAREDGDDDHVIINGKSDSKARVHQVNELPHPYVSIKTFERSIRAPVGSTWVPETAHRKFISPKIKILMGAVIEPLSEEVLIGDEHKLDRFDKTYPLYQVD